MKDKIEFGMEAALQASRDGNSLNGKDDVPTPLIRQLTETAMQAELDDHLVQEDTPHF